MAGGGSIRLLAFVLAAGLVTAQGANARAAAEAGDKPLIAVVPFSGPQAKRAEAIVVRTLRRKAQLIPQTRWVASAKKLFARTHSPEDISSIAEDVGAMIVITGAVKRDGRNWQLSVSVREGATGRSKDKLRYPLKGPRIEGRTLALLADEVEEAFAHTLSVVQQSDGEEPKPPRVKTPPPAKPKEPSKVATLEDEEGKPTKSVEDEKSETPPLGEGEKKVVVVKSAPAGGRPRWAPYFDLSVGASVSGRTFDFTPSSLPHFSSGVVGGMRVDATVYPFASLHGRARGVLATLGIGATLDKPFWPASKGPDGMRYGTEELRVEGGLRWRFVLYKPIPRPELVVNVGGGLHTFGIEKKVDPISGSPTDVGPPDFAYVYVNVGVAFRIHFAEWARLWAGVDYKIVTTAGPATSADGYGPASSFGIRVQGGLDFFVYKGIKLALVGYYDRYQLGFVGSDPPPAKPGNGEIAVRAIDQYFGGLLAVGYVF